MTKELIGYVAVDSGQLLLCDPCYIDSEWEKEHFEDIRIYENIISGERLQYRVHFEHYEDPISKYDGQTMNQLNESGQWKKVDAPKSKNQFSYNACCNVTLSDNEHGQLNFKLGHPGAGVAFCTAFGDGYYPVYAVYGEDGFLTKVEVLFSEEEEDL